MDAAEVTIATIAVCGLLVTLLLLKFGWAAADSDDRAKWCRDPNSWSVRQKAQFWLWFFAFCPVCLLLLGQKPEGRYRRRTPEEREGYLAYQRELEAQDALRRLGEQDSRSSSPGATRSRSEWRRRAMQTKPSASTSPAAKTASVGWRRSPRRSKIT